MTTTMDPPITLELPLDEPAPKPGCDVCAALAKQRDKAAILGDHSQVTDCNVEVRNHARRHRSRQ
ncbi:hypothetical protein [Streptomyces apocyni]|uniref:hypothetical protein n=1 Tax=Streptomyces apocyni TaxID=2654677 RepID=UPI0012EA373B|nr:hypothetical protein [Streptomyces apocyni]